ncbi:NADPH-dependent oxidoreductase [Pelagibius litoralis]|uniref:NADPH-dependent oxidoreductase n=1 Tax=Pelagibius litoralis TaxID=374515 RepID=A0A967KEZ8_9PROT|nr:nitroreductase family protein [Pelagibius litoralis]NIA69301.1 NADPH-dependent oxidoreductase [Pelagibius litoralis]
MTEKTQALGEALAARFCDGSAVDSDLAGAAAEPLTALAARGSVRHFRSAPVAPALLRLLSALALSSPTKSDLQQRDIVLITEPALRQRINALIGDQPWTGEAPALLVFCGNNRRQRQVHALRGRPFVNDHLDAFFNAAVDGGIALSAFVMAAEALGLGCCPISAIRNEAQAVSDLLDLPEHVFPVAGLAVGWPAAAPEISPRLPLSVTLHENRFSEEGIEKAIADYDPLRRYATQRFVEDYGEDTAYGWSEDKARQYSKPERAGFGAFLRRKGFRLD